MYSNFSHVSKIVFGRGSFNQLADVLNPKRINIDAPFIFLVDDVFQGDSWLTSRIPLAYKDEIVYVSTKLEPSTTQIDDLTEDIILRHSEKPSGIIGIGGGSILDIAKAVSIMLTNPGNAESYLGIDLVKNPAIYHVGIPTISGSGSEVSNKAILSVDGKKSTMESDFAVFNQLILDSELSRNVPDDQRFYTALHSFINCAESLKAQNSNEFSRNYANSALRAFKNAFSKNTETNKKADQLMIASWNAGMAVETSDVGIANALSLGLCQGLGIRNALAKCIAFNKLEEYYPKHLLRFKELLSINQIDLPENICESLSDSELRKMTNAAIETVLGKNDSGGTQLKVKISELYSQM